MKSIIKITTCMFLLLFVCFTLASCTDPHAHKWKTEITVPPECEKTGEATKTCVECGAIEKETVAATGHKDGVEKVVVVPGCTTPGQTDTVCPDCGKVFGSKKTDPVGHTPGTLSMIKAPTCTEGGEENSVCTVCGLELGHRDLPPLGHDVEHAEKEVQSEPTCDEDGSVNLICPVCHQQFDTMSTEKLGHQWTITSIIKEPSCTEEGSAEQICIRDSSHKRIVGLKKVEHIYEGTSSIKTPPTCTEPGEMMTSCKNCDAYITTSISPTGHAMNTEPSRKEKEESEFEDGIGVWKCMNCDYEETRPIPMLHVHKTIHDELEPWDYSNMYGENEPGTCVSPGKIYAFCYCYVDDEDNYYLEAGEGRHRYRLVDPETGEPYYKEGSVDPDNHVHYVTETLEGKGYFAAGVEARYCADCGGDRSVTAMPGDKYSAEGLWKGGAEGVVPFYDYDENGNPIVGSVNLSCSIDIEAYPNGTDIFSYQATLDGVMTDVGEVVLGMSDGSLPLMRTTDGRWISIWETGVDPDAEIKRFDLVAGNKTAIIYVTDESPAEQRISFMVYGADPIEDSLIDNVYRQELPTNSGILTIDAEGLSTFSSFSKNEEGMDAVKITKGTPVSLAWIDLTETPATSWKWTDNGSEVSFADSHSFTETEAVDHIITCTAAGETHKVILKFVDPS